VSRLQVDTTTICQTPATALACAALLLQQHQQLYHTSHICLPASLPAAHVTLRSILASWADRSWLPLRATCRSSSGWLSGLQQWDDGSQKRDSRGRLLVRLHGQLQMQQKHSQMLRLVWPRQSTQAHRHAYPAPGPQEPLCDQTETLQMPS
jgi:hypothetical protein